MSDVKRVLWCDIHIDQTCGGPLADEEFVLASDYDALRAELAALDAVNNKGTGIIIELTCELDSLRAELAAANKRLDWLELHLFDGKWNGTIGVPKTWHMAGPYRHTMQRMKGNTLRIALDAAIAGETT